MTAISLLDLLSTERDALRDDPDRGQDRAAALAGQVVEASLLDWERVRQYEEEFASSAWNDDSLDVERSVHALYSEWVAEAEQVLARVRRLVENGASVPNAQSLERAIGRTRAQIKCAPEKIARAMEQVRDGKVVPIKELRDELRARLRSRRLYRLA